MIQGICLGSVSIDCKDPQALCDFYAAMLGWERVELWGCPALRNENALVFLFLEADDFEYIPPVWPEEDGTQQKQMHFDFQIDDLDSAVAAAEALGAVKAAEQYGGEYFVTMLDPEGHPFCLCVKGD